MNPSIFWSRVQKSASCWTWNGCKTHDGYGRYDSKTKAHRASWMLEHGSIPAGMHVLHKCDNRSCVRPSHLFLGSHQENMKDRDIKGRGIRGEKVGIARFNENTIRMLRIAGEALPAYKIARAIGCSASTIHYILANRTWKHVQTNVRLV